LLATVAVGAAVFVGASALLRVEELEELIAAVKRRLERGR